jgi:uncharacterized protein YcbK (DUF882 family)
VPPRGARDGHPLSVAPRGVHRSDKLNEHLRKKGHHVARRSQHVLGHAVDFRLVGVPVQSVLLHLRGSHNGGVGFYPQSGFIHVDGGPRRRWSGA